MIVSKANRKGPKQKYFKTIVSIIDTILKSCDLMNFTVIYQISQLENKS